jgi:hypothetical protein
VFGICKPELAFAIIPSCRNFTKRKKEIIALVAFEAPRVDLSKSVNYLAWSTAFNFHICFLANQEIKFYIACAILTTIKFKKMSFIGKFSTCSVCGKRRIIAKQLNKVLNKQNSVDIYLECKDCAALPLWDTKAGNQKVFDHYQ